MNVVVVGGSGGIGLAFVKRLANRDNISSIQASYYREKPDFSHAKVRWQQLDATDESSVKSWSEYLEDIHWLINAVGILHRPGQAPEKSICKLDPDFFIENVRINTVPSLLLAKHLGGKFKHGDAGIFAVVSAKVGSISDNRLGGWYSYRASKAALNMALKTLSIEWKRTLPNVTVAALHPGTTDTALSKPFQRHVPADQLFTAEQSAGYMLNVLNQLNSAETGKFWAFDGELLDW